MISYVLKNSEVKDNILIPKYYDPELYAEIIGLANTHNLFLLGDLLDEGSVLVQSGHEIGKMAYGTGNIPFVRTSDISNWEIKTIPKQGISQEIYELYATKEDVKPGDILLVRDGTYLIGTNCMITGMDIPMVFQSHILKFRVINSEVIDPYLLFLCLNTSLVQRQIKNMQFTADIIDTLGCRYRELILPIPKSEKKRKEMIVAMSTAVETRVRYKAAIKQMPLLIEQVLASNSIEAIDDFFSRPINQILSGLVQDTTTLEFGGFSAFTLNSGRIANNIYLPKYYDPEIITILDNLKTSCELKSIQDLITHGDIELSTGDEIGKMAYGTGNIPFVRTSDFSNWEIKADTKQGVSEEIYNQYAKNEDVQAKDILIVRDGTYLVGSSCIITELDTKMLYCGGLIKIRVKDNGFINAYLLLGLLNSYIVKRQIRTKQFTRDVIDTLGQRFKEVVIPIPKSTIIRKQISERISAIVNSRIEAREIISTLSQVIVSTECS